MPIRRVLAPVPGEMYTISQIVAAIALKLNCLLCAISSHRSSTVSADRLRYSLLRYLLTSCIFFQLYFLPLASANDAEWQKIGTGLEISRVRLDPGAFLSPELLMVKIDLDQYRIATVRGIDFGSHEKDVRSLSKASKALVGINANFFDEKGKALGLVVSHGITHQRIHSGGKTLTGIFQVTRKGAAIVSRNFFKYDNVLEAIQAGPRLVDAGRPVAGQRSSHISSRRSGICVQSPTTIVLYISSGFIGISIADVQQILLRPGVDCKQALNLDGGGSAQLYVSEQVPGAIPDLQEIIIHGSDDVPVILGVFPRRPM